MAVALVLTCAVTLAVGLTTRRRSHPHGKGGALCLPALWVVANQYYFTVSHRTDSYQLETTALILVTIFGSRRFTIRQGWIFFAGYILLLSDLFHRGQTFFTLAWLLTALAIAVSTGLLTTERLSLDAARMIIDGTVLFSLLGVIDQYLLHGTIYHALEGKSLVTTTYNGTFHRLSGLFGQPNDCGMYVAVVIAIGIGLLIRGNGNRILKFELIFLAIVLIATLSRASLIAALFVGVTTVIWQRRMASLGPLATGGVMATLLSQWGPLQGFIGSITNSSYQSNVARTLIYHASEKAIGAAPWLGYGFGEISVVLPAYVTPGINGVPDPLEDAHDLFFGLALWGGIPLAILVCGALLRGALRFFSASGIHQPWSLGCIAILVNCLFDSPLTSLRHLSLYAVVLAGALYAGRKPARSLRAAGSVRAPEGIAIVTPV